MSTTAATQTQRATETSKSNAKRGKGRGGNINRRGRGGAPGATQQPVAVDDSAPAEGETAGSSPVVAAEAVAGQLAAAALSDAGDMEVCWICAEPVKYYAVPECNHRTCHTCALRLRALYKKMECTFCKEPQTNIIFTKSADKQYASYTPEEVPFKDARLSISFETQDMMEDTLLLLRFNCPDSSCDYMGGGWGDLRLHVRATHGKLMCDLCIRHKKVFTHEHALYAPGQLAAHLPSSSGRPSKAALKDGVEGGVHPFCQFCRECYFGDDEMYAHMREKHEECFICKRNGVVHQYFQNYESLERHFNTDHHPCTQTDCLAQKFVVFNTPLDLKAHMVESHGGDMTARDKREARRIQAEFAFEEVGASGRHGHGRGGRDRDRDRNRDPPPPPQQQQPQASTSAAPAPPSGPTPAGGNRRAAFGGALTDPNAPGTSTPPINRNPTPPGQSSAEADPALLERHASFLNRLQSLAPNPSSAVAAVKAATRGYRFSESSARDLILTVWNVLDHNLEHTASIINAFIDLLDEEDKKQDLLTSWKGFAVEQRRQFPDLTPSSFGSGYAGITSGRVLNAKHATATRTSHSQQVWNRVEQAASSSAAPSAPMRYLTPLPTPQQTQQEKFPALGGGSSTAGPSRTPGGARSTPWSGSSAPPSTLRSQASVVASSSPAPGSLTRKGVAARNQPPPPKLSSALFPELPSAATTRVKPQVRGNVSLQNILGSSGPPAVAAWGSGNAGSSGSANANGSGSGSAPQDTADSPEIGSSGQGGKGKKGKGKQKQTLFTLGAFPT